MTTLPITEPDEYRAAFATPHARHAVRGGTLAYWRFGQGPDVVAVHGWPLHSATFRRLLPHLARSFTVHCFDLPGTGQTRWNDAIGFDDDARALAAGIEAVGLRRYALLAHDSGGVIARLVARDNPRVSGLVLSDTEIPGHHSTLLQLFVLAARSPALGSLLTSLVQRGPVRRSTLGFGTCFTDARYADGDFAEQFVRPLRDPEVAAGQMALLRAFRFEDVDALAQVHTRIRAPTLCIWGERDPFFPVAKARAMLGQFAGGATLQVIPDAKLFPHEDHAAEFAALAIPFLARVSAATVDVEA